MNSKKTHLMRTPRLKFKAFLIATFFSLIVGGIAIYIDNTYKKLSEDVKQTNMDLCEVLALQLKSSAQPVLDSLNNEGYFSEGYKQNSISNNVDRLLSSISEKVFKKISGLEGGFYIIELEGFQGYSYPTSPPPIPVYGPPPRSFNFIKEQVEQSIVNDSLIVKLHQFDPAIFPLATAPVVVDHKVVGAVWTRTHIEKELPRLTFIDILNIAAVVSLLGFILAVTVSIQLRNRLETIRKDLERLEYDSEHRLKSLPGIFGFISSSVNKMVDSLQSENNKREVLERELHQKDKMASLGKLIAGVAHEVKTPLAIIKTRIQMWQKKINTEIAKETISDDSMKLVINEINRLSNLVNRLLIFAKPVNENFRKTNMNQLLTDLINLYRNKIQSDKIEIVFSPDESLPEINADPEKLEQVMLNLIVNSIESINSRGKITIETKVENNQVIISITDTGNGIPMEMQKNIFDPFFTTKDGGTGLGLSIAYEIVRAHKGRIEFESSESVGSTFMIFLPLKTGE